MDSNIQWEIIKHQRENIMTLLNKIKSVSIAEFSDAVVTKILLFGDNTVIDSSNTIILNSTIDYVISTKRLDDSILTPG